MKPYLIMSLLFFVLAVLEAAASSLISAGWLAFIPGTRWLRVHLITLGGLVELTFGLLPALAASRSGQKSPRTNWMTWLSLNAGIFILLAGIPTINEVLIVSGGSLVFTAIILLIRQIFPYRKEFHLEKGRSRPKTSMFYLAGLGYLLIGVLAGTGMWFGWAGPLHIAEPAEVHVHANLWGFTALILAGLLIDLYPAFTGISIARPKATQPIFWGMGIGALGLVIGPWLGLQILTVVGLILHTIASLALLFNCIQPLIKRRARLTPGIVQYLSAYVWFLGPVVVAPLIVYRTGEVAQEVSGSGGPILIYGWLLPILAVVLPYIVRRLFVPGKPSDPGGSWWSLAAFQAGSIIFWMSLFVRSGELYLRSTAYVLWVLFMLITLVDLASILRNEVFPKIPTSAAALEKGENSV